MGCGEWRFCWCCSSRWTGRVHKEDMRIACLFHGVYESMRAPSGPAVRLAVFAAIVAAFAGLVCSTPVFVMLPLDTISNDNVLKDPTGLKNSLNALFTGAPATAGVMTDVFWGLVETSPKSYNWTGYSALFNELLSIKPDITIQVIMSFHTCGGNVGDLCNIPLPSWAVDAARSSDGFYKDEDGNTDEEYLSCGSDTTSYLSGRTPLQVYNDYMQSFHDTFKSLLGTTIVQVQIGLGPAGELRYPSYQLDRWTFPGVGAFQCYDKYLLESLQDAATAAGHGDDWSTPPSDAGSYNSQPSDEPFFTGGYANDYGQFFLNWYSSQLVTHAENVLKLASNVFGKSVSIAGKVAGIHWQYKDPSHAAEATAGYFNCVNSSSSYSNTYSRLASLFAKHNVEFDFTCLEMRDSEQPSSCACGPEELVNQVENAVWGVSHGNMGGENALPRYDTTAYSEIEGKSKAYGSTLDAFTYLRLSDDLVYNQGNLQQFSSFVSDMNSISSSRTRLRRQDDP